MLATSVGPVTREEIIDALHRSRIVTLSITCPHCRAEPGKDCVSREGGRPVINPHRIRVVEARAAQYAEQRAITAAARGEDPPAPPATTKHSITLSPEHYRFLVSQGHGSLSAGIARVVEDAITRQDDFK